MNIRKTAHTLCARLWTRSTIDISMLKTSIKSIFANHLTFSELHDVLFWRMKQAVLADETGHIAARNGLFSSAVCVYAIPGEQLLSVDAHLQV